MVAENHKRVYFTQRKVKYVILLNSLKEKLFLARSAVGTPKMILIINVTLDQG